MVFLTLILSSPRTHLITFLESSLEIEGKENFARLLSRFFKMASSILDNDAWPKSWLNVDILAHKVLLKMFDPIAFLLIRDFVPEQHSSFEFNSSLWREAFYMLLKLLSSDQLVMEDFSPQVNLHIHLTPLLLTLRLKSIRNVGQCGVFLGMSEVKAHPFCCDYGKHWVGLKQCLPVQGF